jgi:exonuclease III
VCATLLNDILGTENIYHLPSDLADVDDFKNLPIYPSLNELKKKYIIKCKTKRILPKLFTDTFRSQHTQIIQNYTKYQKNEDGLKRTVGASIQGSLNNNKDEQVVDDDYSG